jgi:thiol-disulfide isomerase/thioredoxin
MATSGRLDTMEPDPVWDEESYAETVATLARYRDADVRVWGGDWCTDCRRQLPAFGAALEAADVPDGHVHHYPVEKADDGSKTGPLVEEYDIEFIPTVVIERDGTELARFVEDAEVPIAVFLARRLREYEGEI